jgi:hypothetical protein
MQKTTSTFNFYFSQTPQSIMSHHYGIYIFLSLEILTKIDNVPVGFISHIPSDEG